MYCITVVKCIRLFRFFDADAAVCACNTDFNRQKPERKKRKSKIFTLFLVKGSPWKTIQLFYRVAQKFAPISYAV